MDDFGSPSDVAFTASVKAVQARRGSRGGYARIAARGGGFQRRITPELIRFLSEVDTAYLATASAEGQPYAQHRGGPKGFIRALDDTTLAFADYSGNRQYITLGNLAENDQAFLFLMDYATRRRVKIWGRASVVESDPGLVAKLIPEGYPVRAEQAIILKIRAWDINCPQHIPQKLDAADVSRALKELQARIVHLEGLNEQLRAHSTTSSGYDPS